MPNVEFATPSPNPTPAHAPLSLSERINIATRPVHSLLNRLIVVRLPLALPPYTTNPSTYISGLLHIAPIYITFESLWQSILDAPRLPTSLTSTLDACDPDQPLLDSRSVPILPLLASHTPIALVHSPKVCSRTHSLLAHLRLPGLLRAGRLRADIRVLTGIPEHKIDSQLEAVSKNGHLAEFIAHTRKSVETNPHVLLAYAWVLYMALFSGGRYLRATLMEAGGNGAEFWERDPSPVRPYAITREREMSPRRGSISESWEPNTVRAPARAALVRARSENGVSKMILSMQFFNFAGEEDGEDMKVEFKKRITEAEVLLTSGEKDDIIKEAEHIFKFMVELIEELDAVMGSPEDDLYASRLLQCRPLMASRDSIAVTHERLTRRKTTVERKSAGESSHRSNLLEVLPGPVLKVMQYTFALPSWDSTRVLSTKKSQVSFEHQKDLPALEELDHYRFRDSMSFLGLGALSLMLLFWYYMK